MRTGSYFLSSQLLCTLTRPHTALWSVWLFWATRTSLCAVVLSWMERPVLAMVSGDRDGDIDSEVRLTGSRAYWQRDTDVDFLQRRFPGHFPHHLLHNLLNLHYSKHDLCSAPPFTNGEECRHGTHARPLLTPAQVRAPAPAEGALILLPFGLSCRACDDQGAALVDGCAECVILDEHDVCGGCRRVWLGDHPHPASQLPQVGLPLELEGWRRAVGLEQGEPEEEEDAKVEWSEEEWGDEHWEEEHEGEDEWASVKEEGCDASWDADGDGSYGGDGNGWRSQGGSAAAGDDGWGAGRWIEDSWGNWEWTVDFAASATASAVPAAGAPVPEVATAAASQLVSAAVRECSPPGLHRLLRLLLLRLASPSASASWSCS